LERNKKEDNLEITKLESKESGVRKPDVERKKIGSRKVYERKIKRGN
jgi:hypothetical protein